MQNEPLVTALSLFALLWAFGATLAVYSGKRTWPDLSYLAIGYLLLLATVPIAAVVLPGRNLAAHIGRGLLRLQPHQVAAAGLGASIGLAAAAWPWLSTGAGGRNKDWSSRLLRMAGPVTLVSCFLFLSVLALERVLSMYWTHRSVTSVVTNLTDFYAPPGWVLEEFHECRSKPVQIAVGPDANLYYCDRDGGVSRIDCDDKPGRHRETQVAWDLKRVHGLAFYGGALYVSRSGEYSRARHGEMKEMNTGAVTMLRDLNGDGIMDYYHDVVEGLPGAQPPDTVHQNNGIAFGPDGSLYITVGSHANRAHPVSKFEGTILRSRPDGTGLMVFARGMRNPFDCATIPSGDLFCTDNDVGFGNADELNHVIEGGHYGHPYVDSTGPRTGIHPAGAIPPIWMHAEGTLQGLVYAASKKLPAEYRDCLYVVSDTHKEVSGRKEMSGTVIDQLERKEKTSGQIHQVRLARQGNTFSVQHLPFARVSKALDITVDDNGVFYISAYESAKIYRLRWERASSNRPSERRPPAVP